MKRVKYFIASQKYILDTVPCTHIIMALNEFPALYLSKHFLLPSGCRISELGKKQNFEVIYCNLMINACVSITSLKCGHLDFLENPQG